MKGHTLSRVATARRWALVLASVCALVLLCLRAPAWSGWVGMGSYDFVAYWASARVLAQGGNPYGPASVSLARPLTPSADPQAHRMWNPPWTLVLTLPLGFLPFGTALMAWLALDITIVLGGGLLLWDYFCPNDRRYWLGMLLAMGFCPSLLALWMGQISPWMLLGVTGFLWAERGQRDLAAGAFLALLMIKPHVTYLFWLAALWWAWQDGRRRVLIGWLGVLAAASGLVLLIAPDVFANYLVALGNAPLGWHSATFGTWLRVLLAWELSWLQFVPSLLGGLGLLVWLWRRRGPWRWKTLAGPLLLASIITAPYGYSYDQLVLLPAVVALVSAFPAWRPLECMAIIGALLATQVGLWAVNHWSIPDAFNVWHAPAVAGLYWWGARQSCTSNRT